MAIQDNDWHEDEDGCRRCFVVGEPKTRPCRASLYLRLSSVGLRIHAFGEKKVCVVMLWYGTAPGRKRHVVHLMLVIVSRATKTAPY